MKCEQGLKKLQIFFKKSLAFIVGTALIFLASQFESVSAQSWCYAGNLNYCMYTTSNTCQTANAGDPCICGLGFNPGDSSLCDPYVTF